MRSGDVIGRYRIDRLLARGGMAEVYRATVVGPAGFDKAVALKLPLEHVAADPELAELFVDEARLAARLSHRNVVPIVELGESGGRQFIAMELVSGVSLAELLAAGSLPLELALFVVAEVAAGLAYAHGATDDAGQPLRIVHRDVCPSNVLLSDAGEIKLVDFGIAKATLRSRQTDARVIRGKVGYLSPEQANLEEVGPAADQFALGLVLVEAITGRPLYRGDSDLVVLDQARRGAAAERARAAELPPEVGDLIDTLLAPAPHDRFEGADQARAAIVELLARLDPATDDEHRHELAGRVRARRAALETARPPAELVPRPDDRGGPRRRGWYAAALGAVLGVAAVLVVIADRFGAERAATAPDAAAEAAVSDARIVLPAWTNRTGDPALDDLGHLAPARISERLLTAPSLAPVGWYRYDEARVDAPPLPPAARVEGAIERGADGLVVAVTLRGPGGTAQSWRVTSSVEALPAALEQAAGRIAEARGARIAPGRREPPSLEVARLRHLALRGVAGRGPSGYRSAIRRFRELARLRPGDSEPLLWAGVLAWWTGPEGVPWLAEVAADGRGAGASGHVLGALEVMRGFVTDGHLPWRERAHELLAQRPGDPFLMLLAGEANVHTGRVNAGIELLYEAYVQMPQLVYAGHHPLEVALMTGDAARTDRLLALRAADPLDTELAMLALRARVAQRDYRGAIEASRRRGRADAIELQALLLGLVGEHQAASELLERSARAGDPSFALPLAAMALALDRGDREAYEAWIDRALPGGASVLGSASSPSPENDFRFAANAEIIELLAGRDGQWAAVARRSGDALGELTAQDRRLRDVMEALTAAASGDAAALETIAGRADPDVAAFCRGLWAAAHDRPEDALIAHREALAARPDGRFTAIFAHAMAAEARSAGNDRAEAEACEHLRRPRAVDVYLLAARHICSGS